MTNFMKYVEVKNEGLVLHRNIFLQNFFAEEPDGQQEMMNRLA